MLDRLSCVRERERIERSDSCESHESQPESFECVCKRDDECEQLRAKHDGNEDEHTRRTTSRIDPAALAGSACCIRI
jgi:hypothetical protein